MAQLPQGKTNLEEPPETPLSDDERIDLIANLLLDYIDEEQLDEVGLCKTS